MVIGLVCAFGAALAYGIGTVLQAVATRRVARTQGVADGVDLHLLPRLVGSLPYVCGLALDGVGFLAAVVALRSLPLFLVQAAVASSVGVTALAGARWLGVRLTRVEVRALWALGVGLMLLALAAQPEPGHSTSVLVQWVVLGAVMLVAGLAAVSSQWEPSRAGAGLAVAAGLGFGGVGIAARGLQVPAPWWHVASAPLLWALAGYGLVATYCYAAALQRGSATVVAAITFGVETIVPAAVGLAVLGDRARPGFGLGAAAGFVVTLGAAMTLARTREVAPGPTGAVSRQ